MITTFLRDILPASATQTAVLLAAVAVVPVVALLSDRFTSRTISRQGVFVLFGMLTLAFVIEYLLGPSSFVFWDDEGDTCVPALTTGARLLAEGRIFAHEWAGGSDPYSMMSTGMQFLSPERALLSVAPLWVAMAAHKIFNAVLVLLGGLLLARKVAGASTATALVVTAIVMLANVHYLDITICHSVNWGVVSLVAYFFGWRLWQPKPWLPLCAVIVILSMAQPAHIMPAAAIAGLAGLMFARGIRWGLLVVAAVLIAVVNTANWIETSLAMMDMARSTPRTTHVFGLNPWLSLDTWWRISGLAALVGLKLLKDDRFAFVAATAFATVAGLIVALTLAPWPELGIPLLQAIKWSRASYAFDPIVIVVLARFIDRAGNAWGNNRLPRPFSLAVGVMAGLLVSQKGAHLIEYINMGGQSQFERIGNLANRPWADDQLHRTVTLANWMPEPDVVAAYGIDTFDGNFDFPLTNMVDFWQFGVHRGEVIAQPIWQINPTLFNYDAQTYSVDQDISTRYLAIGNVGYLISPLQLTGQGLEEVSAPNPRPYQGVLETRDQKIEYYKHRLKAAIDGFDVYVYRLPNRLPRAFVAAGLEVVPDDLDVEKFIARVGDVALQRIAVVRANDAITLTGNGGDAQIDAVTRTSDGYGIELTARTPAVVVLNVPFAPYWRAEADGREIPVVSVNQVHMAATVPAGSRKVLFKWRRPSLSERLGGR